MKAVIWTGYGPPEVLKPGEVAKPEPKDNEVLIKIHATTVSAGDCEMRRLKFPLLLKIPLMVYAGIPRPKRITVLGQELSGTIETVGKSVHSLKVGDNVVAATTFSMGAYAEYICLPEHATDSVVALKPDSISFEEAAGVPLGGLESLHFLKKADIQDGQKVLINGAGGSIGTFAVQLAKHFGADVTAVDSAAKLDMLRSVGADNVVDFREEDFTRSGIAYDVILDVIGKSPYRRSVASLKPDGCYLIANPRFIKMVKGKITSLLSNKKVVTGTSERTRDRLEYLLKLIESGSIRPVIDKTYPLEQTAEAHRYVEAGEKAGNVIITVD